MKIGRISQITGLDQEQVGNKTGRVQKFFSPTVHEKPVVVLKEPGFKLVKILTCTGFWEPSSNWA